MVVVNQRPNAELAAFGPVDVEGARLRGQRAR